MTEANRVVYAAGNALRVLHGRPLLLERQALDALLLATPSLLIDAARERRSTGYAVVEGVAVLPIMGTLLKRGTGDDWLDDWLGVVSVEGLSQTFARALADPGVESIVLQIDSPGGEARGVFDLADQIFAARGVKPLVAVSDEWAFSAGYLLAAAADRVVVPRTGGVGSIGVYTIRVDASALDTAMGVTWEIVEYGARKADGNPHKPLSDAERDDLRAQVDQIGDLFVDTVARYRGLSATAIRALEARTYTGEDGVRAGLADAVGTFADVALDMATAPRVAGAVKRKETRMDTPQGGEVISLDEHRAKIDAARADAAAQARQESDERVAIFTDMCAAAGRLDLLASFTADRSATVASVAKALSAAKAEAATAEVQGQRVVSQQDMPSASFTFADFQAAHATRNAAIDAAKAARPAAVRVG